MPPMEFESTIFSRRAAADLRLDCAATGTGNNYGYQTKYFVGRLFTCFGMTFLNSIHRCVCFYFPNREKVLGYIHKWERVWGAGGGLTFAPCFGQIKQSMNVLYIAQKCIGSNWYHAVNSQKIL